MATVERTALKWDYAPAPESRDAAPLKPRYDLFIGGQFVAPKDGTVVETKNPATEETARRGRVRRARATWPRGRGRARRRGADGPRCRRWSAASTCSGSRG